MNVPKLRFSNFNKPWESVLLGDICNITKLAGFEFTKYVSYSDEGSIIALRGLNVKKGLLDLTDVKYIDKSDFTKLNRSKLFKEDILFTYVGTIGEAALVDVDDKYYLAPNVCLIRPLEIESAPFLLEYILRAEFKRKIIDPLVTTSSQPSLSMENVRKFSLNIPSLGEQKRISAFMDAFNRKIQLQQEKIDLLKEQKKGFMQKIFSQELRFKDEDGQEFPEWTEEFLGEIGTTFTGLSGKSKEDFGYGNHSFITYVNVFNNLFATETGVEKVNILEDEKQSLVQNGDILLTTSSETPLEVGMASIWTHSTQNLHLNSFCFGYRLHENSSNLPEFVAISLRSEYMRKKIILLAQGSTRFNMSKTELMQQTIKVPSSIEEQAKIINFYKSLDLKLSLARQQLDTLQHKKQAFMQQMFI